MNSEIKTKWLAALRSGKYKQGRSMLLDTVDRSYCCLGVLCEVSGLGSWSGGTYAMDPAFGKASYIPFDIADLLGLESDPRVPFQANRLGLAQLNDRGLTFLQIADLIEAHL
jgi:hypothetical protein